ncbi:hypothetical protein FXO37_16708 [Capsicum annuum]|nr:hypothetical protein FXO37_16708 [Capsicum annuum]
MSMRISANLILLNVLENLMNVLDMRLQHLRYLFWYLQDFSDGKGKKVGEYYSTFHRTPNRKRFSQKEWEDFTQESTKEAVAELAASPEFTDWIIKHADRIQLLPGDSSDESVGSGSDSTDENAAESFSGLGLFNWKHR